jgi:hypothetical protein
MLGGIIFCYVLTVYGLSNILVYGSGPFNIVGKFRTFSSKILPTLGDMLECMMCTSTNVGFIISLIDILILKNIEITPFNVLINNESYWLIIIFLDAFIASGGTWLLHTLQETLESLTNKNNG